MDTFLEIFQNWPKPNFWEQVQAKAEGGQGAEKSANEDRLPWRRRAPPRPPPTKGRPWDHPQPAPERPEGHQCRLAARRGGASGPGPSRPFFARRTAPERAPSERHRSAITTRPQACRASNTCAHKGGGSERHGRQGAGLSTSCVCFFVRPGARWLRTC